MWCICIVWCALWAFRLSTFLKGTRKQSSQSRLEQIFVPNSSFWSVTVHQGAKLFPCAAQPLFNLRFAYLCHGDGVPKCLMRSASDRANSPGDYCFLSPQIKITGYSWHRPAIDTLLQRPTSIFLGRCVIWISQPPHVTPLKTRQTRKWPGDILIDHIQHTFNMSYFSGGKLHFQWCI